MMDLLERLFRRPKSRQLETPKSDPREGPDEALGGKREVPEDAEHVTMVPEHVPMQVRTDDDEAE